jgi:hypothetical protein
MYGNKYPTFFSFADPVGNDSGFDFFTGGDDNIQLHYNSYFPSDSGFGLDPKELHGVDPLKYEQVDFMDMEEEMMMMRPPSSRFDDDMFEDDNYNSDGEEDERDVSNDDMEMNEEDDEEEELSDQSSRSNPVNSGSAVLPASKTPILDATAFCAELKIGAERDADPESIRITDFNTFISQLKIYCPKQHQTQNDEARIKALRRWFDGIPNKKKRKESFVIKMKPEKKNKILVCFKKIQKFVREQGNSPRVESNVPAAQMHFTQQALVSFS